MLYSWHASYCGRREFTNVCNLVAQGQVRVEVKVKKEKLLRMTQVKLVDLLEHIFKWLKEIVRVLHIDCAIVAVRYAAISLADWGGIFVRFRKLWASQQDIKKVKKAFPRLLNHRRLPSPIDNKQRANKIYNLLTISCRSIEILHWAELYSFHIVWWRRPIRFSNLRLDFRSGKPRHYGYQVCRNRWLERHPADRTSSSQDRGPWWDW